MRGVTIDREDQLHGELPHLPDFSHPKPDGGGRSMRMLLAIAILLAGSFPVAVEKPETGFPPTPERKAVDKRLDAIDAEDARAAQLAYDQLARDFPGKEAADEAAWHYAWFHLHQQDLDKGQDLLLALKRSGRKNRWVSQALIDLADVARQRGDERAMLGYLGEALEAPAAPTGRNLMDTLDTRQEAVIRLARHHRDKGDFKRALAYFTAGSPRAGVEPAWPR
jgi:hypothetical protein